jgi:tetratricopeptide (TPR) repeat protein
MQLVLGYHVAHYFGQMSHEDASSLTDWLLSEPDFAASLLDAFCAEDSPAEAFHVMAKLKKEFGERRMMRFPGLAIAHAVVWDGKKSVLPPSGSGIKDQQPVDFEAADSFGYYLSNAPKMKFDLSRMSYEAALFLACAEAAPAERLWAVARFNPSESMDDIYNALEYDEGFLYGKPKKIEGHSFTLPNLLKVGGVCLERAYFAANVARAWGIPAVWITGRGERGGHAWAGYIQPGVSGRYSWELGCGRYEEDRYYTGATHDPQTGKEVNDYQIAMRTKGCSLSAEKRRASKAYVCLAQVLEKSDNVSLAQSALDQAIKNNSFNLDAWNGVCRLSEAGKCDVQYADRVMGEALKRFSSELDFCYGVFTSLMAAVPKDQLPRRKRLYQQAAGFFKARPDLAVAVESDYGDYLLDIGKNREAYGIYYDTIRSHMDDPRLVVDMAIRVTKKRLEGDEPKKAVTLLQALIRCAKKPAYSEGLLADGSAWYRLYDCLAGVYKEMDKQKEADAIEKELRKYGRR